MKPALSALLVLLAALPAAAKPNTLTPKEVADGWLLLFDGETTFGWDTRGKVDVRNGVLAVGGEKVSVARNTTGFGNFELRFDYRLAGKQDVFLVYGEAAGEREHPWNRQSLRKSKSNSDQWSEAKIKVMGRERSTVFEVERGDEIIGVVSAVMATVPNSGPLRVTFRASAGSKVLLRNVKLKPLGLKPVFNGKDLTGWKEFPGRKSKFSVTREGWIHLKNGPGDLQTREKWADFVLQIDCFSNGKHLNSGVFFRCQPDKYQQGYEAQIHNGFTPRPRQYVIEDYDPRTHQRVGTHKVKSTAMDYGTGAIYRRQPARRQVAKDYEWFTMTVVAEGRHIATWVNGIQVADWTDNRPRRDNARNGCRLEAGPISLQGHDRTTDLSFRNIRIAELPKPAPAK